MSLMRSLTLDPEGSFFQRFLYRNVSALSGLAIFTAVGAVAVSLATWHAADPSLSNAVGGEVRNLLGYPGAVVADLALQFLGLGAMMLLISPSIWAWRLIRGGLGRPQLRIAAAWLTAGVTGAAALSAIPQPSGWPLPVGLGGIVGDLLLGLPATFIPGSNWVALSLAGLAFAAIAYMMLLYAAGQGMRHEKVAPSRRKPAADLREREPRGRRAAPVPVVDLEEDDDFADADEDRGPSRLAVALGATIHFIMSFGTLLRRLFTGVRGNLAERRAAEALARPERRVEPSLLIADDEDRDFADLRPGHDMLDLADIDFGDDGALPPPAPRGGVAPKAAKAPKKAETRSAPKIKGHERFVLPALDLLAPPKAAGGKAVSPAVLEENARLLEGVLDDFGVRGEIVQISPGPVVTLYELEPAPGIKSSRVIGLADDIARSMSAIACRVAVIPGKNAIGIELPNTRRETVYLRELLSAGEFKDAKAKLALCMGKTIGGEPVIADLTKMPHLLVAGTTGSGKSVSINTMILSLLYKLTPAECRLIMIDPKMLELSTYEGIPHLLSPVVTDPKKAVVALKWAVREMEERYRIMSKVSVRNIEGLNQRVAQAKQKGETIARTVQTGFDKETGEAIYEREELSLEPMPYIVVIIDEMADLMMVAGKEIEGAVQRLAQMARAAGIHVVMATQRPSVDVITGTIKANFPTRVSFQVTSKIDSRTILGEQGAEQLLGQGDMLYMVGGGRIQRVHGPFVADTEVEEVVAHLKSQGTPEYLDAITADADEDMPAEFMGEGEDGENSNDLYDQAVAVVLRDRKVSTSYIQRRLQIGYNRAASIIERMEREGVVG
ncbi:MAG: DNA translocase FtsK 4TM domain-containing protein, partial [Bauldia sp.]|nr:DNA translocase FtsK 4TM domain-containing protein [Bauldia sp.]